MRLSPVPLNKQTRRCVSLSGRGETGDGSKNKEEGMNPFRRFCKKPEQPKLLTAIDHATEINKTVESMLSKVPADMLVKTTEIFVEMMFPNHHIHRNPKKKEA